MNSWYLMISYFRWFGFSARLANKNSLKIHLTYDSQSIVECTKQTFSLFLSNHFWAFVCRYVKYATATIVKLTHCITENRIISLSKFPLFQIVFTDTSLYNTYSNTLDVRALFSCAVAENPKIIYWRCIWLKFMTF